MLQYGLDACVYAWFAGLLLFGIACYVYAVKLFRLKRMYETNLPVSFVVFCAGTIFLFTALSLTPHVNTDTRNDLVFGSLALLMIWMIVLFPIFDWDSER